MYYWFWKAPNGKKLQFSTPLPQKWEGGYEKCFLSAQNVDIRTSQQQKTVGPIWGNLVAR